MNKPSPIDLSLLAEFIIGAEGDGDADNQSGSNSSDEQSGGAGGASSDASSETDEHVDDEHPDRDDPNTKGLRTALQKERAARAKAEKELAKKQKAEAEAELAKKSDIEQANERERIANEKAQRLVDGFRNQAIDMAIERAASAANFIDTDDALNGVDRSSILVEQDEDDPAQVKVDKKSVEQAVKALATKKTHFVKSAGTTDGEPTGSPRGGTRRTDNEKTAEQVYKDRYPSLS